MLRLSGWDESRIIIWLILPVVIRLYQGLSHACLSIKIIMKLQMAHSNSLVYLIFKLIFLFVKWIIIVILELIHALHQLYKIPAFIRLNQYFSIYTEMIHNNWSNCYSSNKWWRFVLPIILIVVYLITMTLTGYPRLGFDFGEGVWLTANTSTEGRRRENYQILIQRESERNNELGFIFWSQ